MKSDVLIIGGGLVGLAIASSLAQKGISVIVIDDNKIGTDVIPAFDGRASAIALGSKRVLDGIGVWRHLPVPPSPIQDIRISDQQSLFFLHFDHTDVGLGPLGYMLENRHLRIALHNRCQELSNFLTVIQPDTIQSMNRKTNFVTATLSSGRKIQSKLVIGADGRSSQTRQTAEIDVTSWPYHQTAIVCTIKHDISHDFVAHEHFLKSGPFAILPLNGDACPDTIYKGNLSSIVWTETTELADEIMAADDRIFMRELRYRFGDFLGHVECIGPKFSYPLGLQIANQFVDQRLVLIGDAAHAMHPIAGQGLNMGLRDVAALTDVLIKCHQLGGDMGSATVLDQYQIKRRFDNGLMLGATDILNRLFSNNIPVVKLVRDVGLGIVHKLPPVKTFFMKNAMGLVGDIPTLMRAPKQDEE